MNIELNIKGYWVISDIVNGQRIQKTYIGYTKKEAIQKFNQEFLKND